MPGSSCAGGGGCCCSGCCGGSLGGPQAVWPPTPPPRGGDWRKAIQYCEQEASTALWQWNCWLGRQVHVAKQLLPPQRVEAVQQVVAVAGVEGGGPVPDLDMASCLGAPTALNPPPDLADRGGGDGREVSRVVEGGVGCGRGGVGFGGEGRAKGHRQCSTQGLRTDPTLGRRSEGAGSVSTPAPGALSGGRAPAPLPRLLSPRPPHLVPLTFPKTTRARLSAATAMAAATAKWRLRPRHLVGSCPCRAGAGRGRGVGRGPRQSAEATVDGASRSPRRPQHAFAVGQFWGWVGGQGGPTSVRERGRSLALQTLGAPSIIRAAPRNSRANSLREQIKPFLLGKVQRSAGGDQLSEPAEARLSLSIPKLISLTPALPASLLSQTVGFPRHHSVLLIFQNALQTCGESSSPQPRDPHPPRIFKRASSGVCLPFSGWAAPRKTEEEEVGPTGMD